LPEDCAKCRFVQSLPSKLVPAEADSDPSAWAAFMNGLCIKTYQNISKLQVLLKRISDAGTPAISVDFGGAET